VLKKQLYCRYTKKNLKKLPTTKIIYNIFNTIVLLNQSILRKQVVSYETATKFIFLLLIKLKIFNYIYNFFLINILYFYANLDSLCVPIWIRRNKVAVYYFYSHQFGYALKRLILLSRPSRVIYYSFLQAIKYVQFTKIKQNILLSTRKGLIFNYEMQLFKIGGMVLCSII